MPLRSSKKPLEKIPGLSLLTVWPLERTMIFISRLIGQRTGEPSAMLRLPPPLVCNPIFRMSI